MTLSGCACGAAAAEPVLVMIINAGAAIRIIAGKIV
jgi:hypothetical protein